MRRSLTQLSNERGFQLHVSGHVIRTAETDAYVRRDLLLLTPAMICLLAGLLAWVFRGGTSVALALFTVLIPATWAFGLMSWTDRPLTPIVSVMPILILVVGITDAVHFLVRFHDLRPSQASMRDAILEVVTEVGPPTTVTAVTSALGFLSFLAARLPNLRDFGVLAAVGVLGAWLTTFTLIPAALLWFDTRIRARELPAFTLGDRILDVTRSIAWKRSGRVAVGACAGLVVCLLGLTEIVPDNDPLRLLGERDPAVKAERFLRHRLRPLDTIDLLYQAPDGSRVTDPAELNRLEAAEEVLSTHLGSQPVLSILPILRLAHQEAFDGSAHIPDRSGAAAQLLLLAESADTDSVQRFVTADRSVARLSASYAWGGSRGVESDLAALRDELATVLDGTNWDLTGTVSLGSRIGELILEGQIASFSAAFVTIFLVLFAFLRSFRLGVLGMLPNLYPVAVILAFMGFAGIYLDVGTAMIASILLGVSVDDTVYFLMHYQRARRRGADPADAVAYTFAIAGKPALFCAGSLAIGFFVLGFSSFQSLAIFGLLSGVAVLLAAATELVLLPAVLRVATGRGS
jgi:predicted RND superfamily exporter protein